MRRERRPPAGEGTWRVLRLSEEWTGWEGLREMVAAAFAAMEGRIDPPSSVARLTPEELRRAAVEGAVFAALEGGEAVGCVVAAEKGDALYLSKLAVREDRRGRGIARALVAAAEAEAAARDLAALELQTRVELTENHAAFAQLGFARVGQTSHLGFDRPTSVTMRRPVAPAARGR